MTKIFISQPMQYKTLGEILAVRDNVRTVLAELYGADGYEIVNPTKQDYTGKESPLDALGTALRQLSTADAAYFAEGWQNYRGCRTEHQCCLDYGIKILKD